MKAVIQRSREASVAVNGQVVGQIGHGLVVLLGATHEDTEEDADYIGKKLVNLRIFEDKEGKMNHSLKDVNGEVLSISQFTLLADTRKGRRPNFMSAAKPGQAEALYNYFNRQIEEQFGIHVETGEFGAMMDVELVNEGPVTIIIDSKDK